MTSTIMVSPCGTSVLTNQADEVTRKLLIATANFREKELTQDQKTIIDAHLAQRKQQIQNASIGDARKLSAELNGIITYYNGTPKEQHILLATDTYLGIKTAEIVANWLKLQNLNVIPKVVPNLSTRDVESFRVAISEIFRWCGEELELQYPRPNWKVVFNLTGGFKSVNGFLQAISFFYADESIYIFESGGELLKIPRIPVKLDPEGIVEKHLETFRRMAVLKKEISIQECAGIPEVFLEQIDDRVLLSEWGELVWQKCKKENYSKVILPALSQNLKYSENFEKEANELPDERKIIINERLDQLSCYLESRKPNQQLHNPSSLDFKALKGRPFSHLSPEPTHECDAWSDGDAKRLFGYFKGSDYVINHLGNHLK